MNSTVFPSPHEFRPERWLDGDPKLDQYMCSFSRGTRGCIGMKYVPPNHTQTSPFPHFCLLRLPSLRSHFIHYSYRPSLAFTEKKSSTLIFVVD